MYKKIIISLLCCFFTLHTMDSDIFGGYMVLISNELNVQEKDEEKQQEIKNLDQEIKNINKEQKMEHEFEYSSTEIKLISIGLFVSMAILILDYIKR